MLLSPNLSMILKVGARSSPLSKVQVQEVLKELNTYYPEIRFDCLFMDTVGDKDQKTSLRSLEKTNFFTKEVDELQLCGQCRISIHSAKDLPEPIPKGLKIIAITKGLDPRDSLVMRQNDSFESLQKNAIIATSSVRREDVVKSLRDDLRFIDLRGTINQRLSLLETKKADGVIVAEAALIRLGLIHLNRFFLPGDTVAFQGQLAILAREDDQEMDELFECLDTRKKILYLGLDAPQSSTSAKVIHYPMIQIVPRGTNSPDILHCMSHLKQFTHIIFTSKTSVRLLMSLLATDDLDILKQKHLIAVGSKTAETLEIHGISVQTIAKEETAEGIIDELKSMNLSQAKFFWPHSALSRTLIPDYLKANNIDYFDCVLYDTIPRKSEPAFNLDLIDEIVFTSPSCVDAFVQAYGKIPANKIISSIGPVTTAALLSSKYSTVTI